MADLVSDAIVVSQGLYPNHTFELPAAGSSETRLEGDSGLLCHARANEHCCLELQEDRLRRVSSFGPGWEPTAQSMGVVLSALLVEAGAREGFLLIAGVGMPVTGAVAGFAMAPLATEDGGCWLGLRDGVFPVGGAWLGVAASLVSAFRKTYRQRQVARDREVQFDTPGALHIYWDGVSHFTRVSPAFQELLGYSYDELYRRPILDFIHPDDRERTYVEGLETGQGLPLLAFENRYLCADGRVCNLQWTCPDVGSVAVRLFGMAVDITEQKRMQAEWQRLALIARHTRSGAALLDVAARIEWVNESFELTSGYHATEVVGLELLELLTRQGMQSDMAARLRRRLEDDEGFRVDLKLRRKGGDVYWAEVDLQPVWGENRRLEGFMAVEMDITQRKEDEATLLDAARRLADAGAMAKLGGWELDLDGNRISWSDEVCRIHDMPPGYVPDLEEAIRFYTPAAREAIRDLVQRAIETGEGWDTELPLVTALGREIWVRASGRAEMENGVAKRLVGTFQEITERRLRDQQLRRSEARNRALLAALPDYLLQIAADGTVVDFHDRPRGNPNFPLRYAAGKKLADCFDAELASRFERAMEKTRVSGSISIVDYGQDLAGKTCHFEARLARTQLGEFLLLIRDVTKRREAEEASLTYVDDLESARRELEVEKRKAESASRAKSEFLAVMSHEIRTPMNAVLGMTRLLLDSGLVGEQQEMAQTVMGSGEALLEIINDILDFSKIEAGKTDLESIEFDLEQTLEDVVELMNAKAQERGIELLYWFDPATPRMVLGVPARLRQMALNFVSNAIKFTVEGYVLLRVTPAGESRVRVDVEDTGHGIAANKLPLLFQRFTQADSTTTRRFGGTGLGLAIVKELAELMGGAVSATSTEGRGSVFSFEVALPGQPEAVVTPLRVPRLRAIGTPGGVRAVERLRREIEKAYRPNEDREVVVDDFELSRPMTGNALLERLFGGENRRVKEPVVARPLANFQGLRMLLVEDNVINQKVGSRLLEKLGCRVDIAANGFEAVQMAGQLPYDLIFMDCQMPEMDGFQASRQIRMLGGPLKRVGIVALTAAATPEDRVKCLDSGMNDYLSKPVTIEALTGAIQKWSAAANIPLAGPLEHVS